MATRITAARAAKERKLGITGSKTPTTKPKVSVSSSRFGISGAGSNAAILAKYGSTEAKTATASTVTPLTAKQKARSDAIPRKAVAESETLNANSPTTSVIKGNAFFDFGQGRTPTSVGINNLASKNPSRAVSAVVNEQAQKEKSGTGLFQRLTDTINSLADLRNTADSRLFGGTLPGGPTPSFISANRVNDETAAKTAAMIADAQERIQKAALDAQAELEIARNAAKSDLFDVSFLEKLGIGRSAEERKIQDLIAQNAYLEEQRGMAQSVTEAFRRAQEVTNTPEFVAAQATATPKDNTLRNVAIAGAIGIGLLFVLSR